VSDLLLNDAERRRFSVWLQHEASSSLGIAEQAEKMIPGPAGRLFSQRERGYAAACVLIARRLDDTESMTVGDAG